MGLTYIGIGQNGCTLTYTASANGCGVSVFDYKVYRSALSLEEITNIYNYEKCNILNHIISFY